VRRVEGESGKLKAGGGERRRPSGVDPRDPWSMGWSLAGGAWCLPLRVHFSSHSRKRPRDFRECELELLGNAGILPAQGSGDSGAGWRSHSEPSFMRFRFQFLSPPLGGEKLKSENHVSVVGVRGAEGGAGAKPRGGEGAAIGVHSCLSAVHRLGLPRFARNFPVFSEGNSGNLGTLLKFVSRVDITGTCTRYFPLIPPRPAPPLPP
jgi:hypothetical protein